MHEAESELAPDFPEFHVEIKAQSIKGSEKIPFGSGGILFVPTILINHKLMLFKPAEFGEPDEKGVSEATTHYGATIQIDPFMIIRLDGLSEESFAELGSPTLENGFMDEKDTPESFSLAVSSLAIFESQVFGRDVDSFR